MNRIFPLPEPNKPMTPFRPEPCDLPVASRRYSFGVWDQDKKEWKTLSVNEKTGQKIQEWREQVEREHGSPSILVVSTQKIES